MLFNFSQRFRDYRTRRQVTDFLSRMNDRDLSDIGLARGDVDLVVKQGRLTV